MLKDTTSRKSAEIVLGENISFPAYGDRSLSSQVVFVTGKRGSGKSWTTGVMMEELEKADLQFACLVVAHNPDIPQK